MQTERAKKSFYETRNQERSLRKGQVVATGFDQQVGLNLKIYLTNFKLTLLESPSNSCRKLACVPVVPLTPRNLRSSRARCMFRRSMSSSWIHRHARLPTVVNWAGLEHGGGYKTFNPAGG